MHRSTILPRPTTPPPAAPCPADSADRDAPAPTGVLQKAGRPRWARDSHDYMEVDLDELVRTSLALSVEDLVQRHRDDQRQKTIEAETERRARQLSAQQRRIREEAAERLRLRAAEEHGRLASLHRRQRLAQEQASIDVQAEVQEIYRRAAARMREFSKTARQGQTVALFRLQKEKRLLLQALMLTLILLSAGAISLWDLNERRREQHAEDVTALTHRASAQVSAAENRARAIEQALATSRILNEQQKRELQEALSTIQTEVPSARGSLGRSSATQNALVRPLKRSTDLSPDSDRPAPAAASLASREIPMEPTSNCLSGDPLCFGL